MAQVIMTDRLAIIEPQEVAEFKADPEGFLRKIGALEALPSFNGIDLSDISSESEIRIMCSHQCDCSWKSCA